MITNTYPFSISACRQANRQKRITHKTTFNSILYKQHIILNGEMDGIEDTREINPRYNIPNKSLLKSNFYHPIQAYMKNEKI